MESASAYGAYLTGSVQTASPAQLVLALYDRALVALDRAATALAARSVDAIEPAHRELVRAQSIVIELRASLDHEHGGQIASSLDALYGFCLERLIRANVTKSTGPIGEAGQVLGSLREAWAEAVCQGPIVLQTAGSTEP
jgi:flagellar protein FliS